MRGAAAPLAITLERAGYKRMLVTTWRGHYQLNEDRHEVRAWSTRPFVTVKISREHDHIEDDVTAYTAVRAPWPAAREPALWGDTCGL